MRFYSFMGSLQMTIALISGFIDTNLPTWAVLYLFLSGLFIIIFDTYMEHKKGASR